MESAADALRAKLAELAGVEQSLRARQRGLMVIGDALSESYRPTIVAALQDNQVYLNDVLGAMDVLSNLLERLDGLANRGYPAVPRMMVPAAVRAAISNGLADVQTALAGLALSDEPSPIGATEIHLSITGLDSAG